MLPIHDTTPDAPDPRFPALQPAEIVNELMNVHSNSPFRTRRHLAFRQLHHLNLLILAACRHQKMASRSPRDASSRHSSALAGESPSSFR